MIVVLPLALTAQTARDVAPLKHWPAPLYWQPTEEERALAAKSEISGEPIPHAETPANSLVFVGMTPCRVVDTRSGSGLTGAFGPPSLVAGATRSFPPRASTTCSIPSIAQAYSLNVTAVPPGFLGYLTIWPFGAPRPLASTLNDSLGTVVANAAIVPAGSDTSGSVDVYVSNSTDVVIDINGYYAPQSGITLAQGSAGAPSLSFSGDAGTGIYSSAAGTVNIATGGTNSVTVDSHGDVDIPGSIRKNGALFLHNLGGYGGQNTAVGLSALSSNLAGGNTASGFYALQSNTSGYENTATGAGALQNNINGFDNVATGYNALQIDTEPEQNTATGAYALANNNGGLLNTAAGAYALVHNTRGCYNMASGTWSLKGNSTGNYNTAAGTGALFNNSTGSYNTAIGYYSAANVSGASSNNIHIGSYGASGDNATIRIGGNTALGDPATQTSFFASGIRNITTGQNNAVPVVIDSNGQVGTMSSARRYKEDITDMGDATNGLMKLRPVTFRYKKPFDDGSKPIQYGLIAEEVAEVYPDLVARSADGQIEAVKYQLLDSMLLNELQKQNATIAAQKEQIRAQEQRIAAQEQQNRTLEERLAKVEAVLSRTTVSASR